MRIRGISARHLTAGSFRAHQPARSWRRNPRKISVRYVDFGSSSAIRLLCRFVVSASISKAESKTHICLSIYGTGVSESFPKMADARHNALLQVPKNLNFFGNCCNILYFAAYL